MKSIFINYRVLRQRRQTKEEEKNINKNENGNKTKYLTARYARFMKKKRKQKEK